jgi:hypothetical protein
VLQLKSFYYSLLGHCCCSSSAAAAALAQNFISILAYPKEFFFFSEVVPAYAWFINAGVIISEAKGRRNQEPKRPLHGEKGRKTKANRSPCFIPQGQERRVQHSTAAV